MAHTPMENLRDKLQVVVDELKDAVPETDQYGYRAAMENVIKDIDLQMLSQERQMVIDAYTAGQKIMIDVVSEILPIVKTQAELQKVFDGEDNEDADQYFNNKFKK